MCGCGPAVCPHRGAPVVKPFFTFLLTCLLLSIRMPCRAAQPQEPVRGDSLIVGTVGEPSVLIPMLASDSASHDVAGLMLNGLVKYGPDLHLTGDLADSWDVSPDGLTITFHLRRDVCWEDGVPFTARDVLFGFNTITDPQTPTAYAEDFLQVKRAEVPDPHTFRVTYERPFAPALGSWGSLVVLPEHRLRGTQLNHSSLARHPLSIGPFRFMEWKPGEKIVLAANDRYFPGRPFLDRYIYRFIPDPATLFLELKAGSIDMMSLTPLQYTRQTGSAWFRQNFNKYRIPSFSYTYLGFNLRHPWFKDRRVRRAIAHAIDKQELIDGVLLGMGRISTGPYVPGTWPCNPDVITHPVDTTAARRLLRQAGWVDTDNDGILDRDGRPFEFTILTNMGNPLRMKTATIIQWRLEMIGIRVNIRVLEWATFINEFIDTRRFEAVILGWSIGLDPDQYDIWHSSKTGEKQLNFVGYANHEVDELLERGRRTFDITRRKHYYDRFQEILANELPYIFLYVPDGLPIVSSRVHNIRPTPVGIRYNIHRWFVPGPLQKHRFAP